MALKQWFWNLWYRYLSRKIGQENVDFLNYGFWPSEGKTVDLSPDDEPHRPAIQLYHRVVGDGTLTGKDVLEVSCGHGGGARYLVKAQKPKSYCAVDQNQRGIERNRKVHVGSGIDFQIADAQELSFPAETFDVVVNVEASHCYPRMDDFAASAFRVLKKGGTLRWADFRAPSEMKELESLFTKVGFEVQNKQDITESVLAALKRTSENFRALVRRYTPKILHKATMAFAAVEGSTIYESFVLRKREYWVYALVKK